MELQPEFNDRMAGSAPGKAVMTVTELTRKIKTALKTGVGYVHVSGEVSNARFPASGHVYFTLKDQNSQISAVLFKRQFQTLKFKLADGIEVVAFGEVGVYEKRGEYQIVVERLEPKGVGALQLAFEQLKSKLKAEGLFDQSRKRPLPFLPRRVGVVTSATGAAVRDIIDVSLRRFPQASILIHPVKVQGEGAAQEIASAIAAMNRIGGMDVLIVGRGGGSIEDLWAFNEEPVARAVAASAIPVVSAVGHEIDFTICDFVADMRAATPSVAAELVFPRRDVLDEKLGTLRGSLVEALEGVFESAERRVDDAAERLDPGRFQRAVAEKLRRVLDLGERLDGSAERQFRGRRERLESLGSRLDALGPPGVMRRGYSVTICGTTGKVLTSIADAPPGTAITTVLADGRLKSLVQQETGEINSSGNQGAP